MYNTALKLIWIILKHACSWLKNLEYDTCLLQHGLGIVSHNLYLFTEEHSLICISRKFRLEDPSFFKTKDLNTPTNTNRSIQVSPENKFWLFQLVLLYKRKTFPLILVYHSQRKMLFMFLFFWQTTRRKHTFLLSLSFSTANQKLCKQRKQDCIHSDQI